MRLKFITRFLEFTSSKCGRFDVIRKANGLWQAIDWDHGTSHKSESKDVCIEWCEAQRKRGLKHEPCR